MDHSWTLRDGPKSSRGGASLFPLVLNVWLQRCPKQSQDLRIDLSKLAQDLRAERMFCNLIPGMPPGSAQNRSKSIIARLPFQQGGFLIATRTSTAGFTTMKSSQLAQSKRPSFRGHTTTCQ
jgi:hypothetical protein